MTFAAPLGLLALLAIPVIVAIHLFRRRFPVRPVAGLFLWQSARQIPVEGRRIARLPLTASLILECVAALALALILAGARVSSAGAHAHLVVLLDDSASMAAANAQGESARDRAARRVLEELDRLGASARITIVASGPRPAVLAGPDAYAVEARGALDAWRPQAPHHSLALGIRLARELAGPGGSLMIVSDQTPDARGEGEVAGALWAALGEPLPNVGIVAADRMVSPEEGRGVISLALANHSDGPVQRRVTVSAGETQVLVRELNLEPGVSSVVLPIAPGLPTVDVALAGDALARDDAVTLAEPRARIVRVGNELPEGRGREALARALESVTGVTSADPAHLVFLDAAGLDRKAADGVWRAGFGTAAAAWLAPGEPADFTGPFVIEKRHPLLLGVTLNGVVWPAAARLQPVAVRPLVSAGDQALIAVPLEPAALAVTSILFNLDLDRTNLIRAPDWPILISNLVEMRRQALPGPQRWNYRIGEWVRLRLGRTPSAPVRYRAGGVERTLPGGRELEFIAPSPGGALQIVEGEDALFEIGVNFLDQTESDLRHRTSADIGALAGRPELTGERAQSFDPLFWILLALAVAAIAGNWWVLSPARARA